MRILNMKQLRNAVKVDQVNPSYGNRADLRRMRQNVNEMDTIQRVALDMQARGHALGAMEERARELEAHRRDQMLQRSLRNTGHAVHYASKHQGSGNVPRYGVKTPGLGFVDATLQTSNPDYSQHEVYEAQQFNNCLASQDMVGYSKFKDYPLVLDSPKGDFGGLLTDEKGSADFSTWIVNDDRQDFGYVPQRRRR